MREVGIVPVLPGVPVEVVGRHFAPEPAAVLAEGDAALERRLAGELEQVLDAAGGLNLADQERRGGDGVAHGAVRRMVAGHVGPNPTKVRRGTCKTLSDQDPDPPQGTGLGAIGNDFWLERRFVPPTEEPDRGVGFCFGLVFGVRA